MLARRALVAGVGSSRAAWQIAEAGSSCGTRLRGPVGVPSRLASSASATEPAALLLARNSRTHVGSLTEAHALRPSIRDLVQRQRSIREACFAQRSLSTTARRHRSEANPASKEESAPPHADATGVQEGKKLEAQAASRTGAAPGDQSDGTKNLGQYEPQKLSEDIMTLPNVLTMVRLASTPVLGYLIIIDEMRYALALLAVAGFTDALDGWLARKFGSATVFGSIADPAADKALMTIMVGALAWRGLIPLPLVFLIIGRDVALIMSAFLIRWRSLPPPKTFSRYFNPRLPSAKVMPTQVSKYNTLLQIILVGICTLLASLSESNRQWWAERQGLWADGDAGKEGASKSAESRSARDKWGDIAKKSWHAFMLLVSGTTIWSGASYLSGAGAVNVVSNRVRTATAAATRRPPPPPHS